MSSAQSAAWDNREGGMDLEGKIEQLRKAVRSGDFERLDLVEEIWSQRSSLPLNDFHRLSIHTLSWEIFDSRGDYKRAASYLRDGHVVEQAIQLLMTSSVNPAEFIAREFPGSLRTAERERRYNLWRQHAMAALANCFCAFRLHEHGYEPRLELVRMFVDRCLGEAGFPCNGTRARLHFFMAQICEARHDIGHAADQYNCSLHYCLRRAEARLRPDVSAEQQKTEQAFAIYCLGKLKLRLGQIEADQGHLAIARDHAREAGLLLRISRDRYLPEMAKLLACHIGRHDDTLHRDGQALLSEIRKVRQSVLDHKPFHLEARLEETIVSVYLVPRATENAQQFRDALTDLHSILSEARELRLPTVEFGALLAAARTHAHLGQWGEAHAALKEAHVMASASPSRKAEAEVKYVEGKVHAAEGKHLQQQRLKAARVSFRVALECFREAARLKHPRITFQVACAEHSADLLLRRGRVVEAKRILKRAQRQLRGIEETFLRKRIEKLLAQIEFSRYAVIEFRPPFDLDAATDELERRFLNSVAHAIGKDLPEIRRNWKQYAARLDPLEYYQLKRLIKKHYPNAEGTPLR